MNKLKELSMPRLWIINQFANTPKLPGHTRQYEIAIGLRELGWDVDVFASDFNLSQRRFNHLRNFQLAKAEKIHNITWNWLRVFPYKKNDWKRYLNMISFCAHLPIYILCKNLFNFSSPKIPDIIFASSPQLPAAFVSLLIASVLNKPFVLEVRDLWPQTLIDLGGKSSKSLIVKILRWIEQKVYKEASCVVVLAKGAESYVLRYGARKAIWLPNGPDLDVFYPTPLPPEEYGFNQDRPFNILYAGAHGEANDLENVIEAARLLQKQAIKFTFIGDGPRKQDLIAQSKGLANIEFREPVPKTDMPLIMSTFDAILLSLRDIQLFKYGVSPNKLYDAYASARPVITTVEGSINNEVLDNRLGVATPPGDPKALSLAIEQLIKISRSERINMGKRARKLAEKTYSRSRINIVLNDLLRQML